MKQRGKTMKTMRFLVLIATATPLCVVAADDSASIDTSQWKCKYCVVEEGWRGELDLGLGNLSMNSFKFGEYNGINESGVFFITNANLSYRDPDASYLDLSASDLGLDSRSLTIEGGQQGKYDLFLEYNEIPHYISSTAVTPYTGSGTSSLTLPGWVPSGTTGSMPGLAASLKNIDLETQRKRLGVGLSLSTDSHWNYDINFRHDTKEGTRRIAGAFFLNTAQLVQPVDYVTDEMDVSVSYATRKLQASLSYYGSVFSNNNKSLTWDNAYTAAGSGQLALPPDNQFNQIMLSAGYNLTEKNHLSGDIAFGRMEQNEALLAATLNSSVVDPTPGTVPLTTATGTSNATINTLDAKLRLVSALSKDFKLNSTVSYNDRDNTTPRSIYDLVTTDILVTGQPTNLPYSTTKSKIKLNADYRQNSRTKLAAGYDIDILERTFQDIEKTTEQTLWGRIRTRTIDKYFVELKIAQTRRDASTVAVVNPSENTLLRKYNMADRTRDTLGLHINVTPDPRYTIALNLDFSDSEYDKSTLGLTDSSEYSLSGDISTMLDEDTFLNAFVGYEIVKSTQAGSQTFSSADWIASNDDTFDNIGLGLTHVLIDDKLDIGADISRSRSTGKIAISGTGSPLPDLKTSRDTLKLYANYHLQEMITLRADYWYEHYSSRDWALDGVSPNTIPNALTLGEQSPAYNVHVIMVSARYKF